MVAKYDNDWNLELNSAGLRKSIMGKTSTGYILAPCHNLQVNTSVENIVAMYDEAWKYGKRYEHCAIFS